MRQTTALRLGRLESAATAKAGGPTAIVWQVVGKIGDEPVRCENLRTGQSWAREPGESASAFELRVVEEARRLPGMPWLVMHPAEQT